MSVKYHLYSSEGCHLCEQALKLCMVVLNIQQLDIIDIVNDEGLVELYGVHIPVLERMSDNTKLFWPFSQQDIEKLVK
ncbi:glutaredoxin family protein [Thalassotalea profundi]|uniref:Thioredoxin family protein n=1 Tax=Thalassotalea profundi TaxID=2036687 RepID=A0ABQ3II89_9GAMM|nr:glutaredoxin family protein [Thalassotalea profundi]GHE82249.1 thioredoxin family protein [Thalassotalea profundi]